MTDRRISCIDHRRAFESAEGISLLRCFEKVGVHEGRTDIVGSDISGMVPILP